MTRALCPNVGIGAIRQRVLQFRVGGTYRTHVRPGHAVNNAGYGRSNSGDNAK